MPRAAHRDEVPESCDTVTGGVAGLVVGGLVNEAVEPSHHLPARERDGAAQRVGCAGQRGASGGGSCRIRPESRTG